MNKKLGMKQILCYGSGAISGNMFGQFNALFLMLFFTDILGVNPVIAGSIYSIVNWIAAVGDAGVGFISDRTGHYKRWVFGGGVAAAILFVLMYTNIGLSGAIVTAYAFILFLLWNIAYSAHAVSYNAMASVMSTDGETRNLINATRFALLAIPSIAISVLTPYLTTQQSNSANYTKGAVAFSIIAIIFVIPTVLGVQEPIKVTRNEKPSLADSLKSIFGNSQLVVLSLTYMAWAMGYGIYMSMMTYFFSYHYISAKMMSIIMILVAPLSIIGSVMVPPLAKRIGKKMTLLSAAVLFIVSMGVMFAIPTSGAVVFVCNTLVLLAFNIMSPIVTILMSDAIDYGVWKTKKNVRAASFSLISIMGKFAGGLNGLIVGGVLTGFGYVANATQSTHALTGITFGFCLVPAAMYLIVILLMGFGWKLNEKRMAEIAADLDSFEAAKEN